MICVELVVPGSRGASDAWTSNFCIFDDRNTDAKIGNLGFHWFWCGQKKILTFVPIKRHKLLLRLRGPSETSEPSWPRLLLHSLKLIIFILVSKIQGCLTEVLNALLDRHYEGGIKTPKESMV